MKYLLLMLPACTFAITAAGSFTASRQVGGARTSLERTSASTAPTLVVHPSFYKLNAASGVPLSKSISTKIPLFAAPGQQAAPINLTISGVAKPACQEPSPQRCVPMVVLGILDRASIKERQ